MVVRRTMANLHEAETMRVIPDLVVVLDPKRALAAGIGDPSEIDEECEPVYLYNSPVNDRSDFVFNVNGESMEPEYHDGDRVLVRKLTSRHEIAPGDIGAFMINNERHEMEFEQKQYEKELEKAKGQALRVVEQAKREAYALLQELDKLKKELYRKSPKAEFIFIAPWYSTDGDPFTDLTYPEKTKLNEEYSGALEKYCQNNKLMYINPNPTIRKALEIAPDSRYLLDHIHPNASKGVIMYSEAVLSE